MRSLDPLDELADEINREINDRDDSRVRQNGFIPNKKMTKTDPGAYPRRETGQAQVAHSIVSESDDNISRAMD